MMTSNQPSTPPLPQVPGSNLVTKFLAAIAAVSFVGFVDSAYLAADHYFTLPLPCGLTHGCETVLTSPYAMVGPIPLALFGVAYYLIVMFFALYLYTAESISRRETRALLALTLVGFLMSAIFMAIQIFLIKAVCQYCALSALCTVILLLCGTWLVRAQNTKK